MSYCRSVQPHELNVHEVVTVAEFRSALRRFLRRSELVADGCGLTPQRYLLLLMIKGAPDGSGRSTVTGLADSLQLAQSTITELVARSVDAGLVAREGSTSDARVTYLRLTAEGERRLACSFTGLSAERSALYEAIGTLQPKA
jgi:DNA-binding MarR family transcriptional regulator